MCGVDFERYSSFLTYFKEREDFEFCEERLLLRVFGIKSSQYAYTGVFTGMAYDYKLHISKSGENYSLGFVYDLEKIDIYEDIVIELLYMDKAATYIDMAKRYRRYMIEERGCVPIKERSNTTLDYIKDSVEIRIRMGWKSAPPTILEQTIENEPEMYVACTFDDVKEFIKRLKESGVKKAQICLVGWNVSGHDGRWPTAFPVEQALGGEEKLRELLAYAREIDYRIIGHTNSTDCYSISEYFNNGEIALKNKAGEIVADEEAWSGGRMYHLCPKRAWELAQKTLPEVLKLGFSGAHYVDVLSIIKPRTCFDKNHPCNAGETVEYWRKIGKKAKELFGGFSSEGIFDHSADYLDFGLYVNLNRKRHSFMDKGINLWELIFHGIIMANASTDTINYPIKSNDGRLLMAELGYRPAMYVNLSFMNKQDTYWKGIDIKINTEEEMQKAVNATKEAYDEYTKLRYLQIEEITDYKELCEDIVEVTYSDGTVITVNYSDKEFQGIKPRDYTRRNAKC